MEQKGVELSGSASGRTLGTAIGRGVRRVCPDCGQGRLFAGWFRMERECAVCGSGFERGPGYFLGSAYVNYGVTAGSTTVAYVVLHFGLGVSNRVLLPVLAGFCVVFPLVFFRFARSLWLNLDSFLDPDSACLARNSSGTKNAKKV